MMSQLRSVLAGKDPSLPLAMAALLDKADDSGSVTFRDLAVAYREEYLEVQRTEWGETGRQGGGRGRCPLEGFTICQDRRSFYQRLGGSNRDPVGYRGRPEQH